MTNDRTLGRTLEQFHLYVYVLTLALLALLFIGLFCRERVHRRRLTKYLEQKRRMESLGRLAGRVAHDFNNQLMVILSNAELLKPRIDPSVGDQYLDKIFAAVTRSSNLTNGLLSFSRGESAIVETIDLSRHLVISIPSMQGAVATNIKVQTDYEHELPPIRVDKVQLDVAVLNMMMNSSDAMAGTSGTISIKTWRERHGDKHFVSMSVEDTGGGIPKHILPNVFEPFVTSKQEGTGLGLSQVYGFVRDSGGMIDMDSNSSGTRITISFPAYLDG